MFGGNFLQIIKTRKTNRKKRVKLNPAFMIIEYYVAPDCKRERKAGSICLKCGECGRKFDVHEMVVDE